MTPCQADMGSDWAKKEFHMRNKRKVELRSTFSLRYCFARNLTVHAYDARGAN